MVVVAFLSEYLATLTISYGYRVREPEIQHLVYYIQWDESNPGERKFLAQLPEKVKTKCASARASFAVTQLANIILFGVRRGWLGS